MLKGILLLLFIFNFSCPSWAAVSIEQYREDIKINALRKSATYMRTYEICATAYDLSKTVYAKAAAAETIKMAFFNTTEWENKIVQEYKISALLENDLQHPGFRMALKDCGYTEVREKYFVLNLIALDIFGKLGGLGVSGWLYTKVIWRISRTLMTRFPKTMMATSAASIALVLRDAWKRYAENENTNENTTLNAAPAAPKEDFAASFLEKANIDEMRATRMQLIEAKIAEINAELKGLTPAESRFHELEEKKASLLELAAL